MNAWNLTGRAPAPASGGGDALSVSQAVKMAADVVDGIPQLAILGEVTGFRGPNARSGHCYFQVKDDACAMDCAIWKGAYAKRAIDLHDGMQVILVGKFNVYAAQGKMKFIAESFSLAGEGLLRQQVAQLAEKLRREGLMEPARKRHIPVFCTRVAVVTSLSGAVIDDVKRTLRRRNPLLELVCVGAKVQGEGAPAELIEGLGRAACIRPAPDCILLVRGGGSFEDLMTFNDEDLARAVAASPIPVVTGIGHEPDTSICDMVSDRRCSTPTAAAESVAPAMSELVDVLDSREQRLLASFTTCLVAARGTEEALSEQMDRAMRAQLDRLGSRVDAAASRPCLARPDYLVDRRASELTQACDRFQGACDRLLARFDERLALLGPRLAASTSGFSGKRHELALATTRLGHAGRGLLGDASSGLARDAAALDALSPLKVLARGYSIAYDGAGAVVTRAGSLKPGDAMRVRMADGDVYGTVTEVKSS